MLEYPRELRPEVGELAGLVLLLERLVAAQVVQHRQGQAEQLVQRRVVGGQHVPERGAGHAQHQGALLHAQPEQVGEEAEHGAGNAGQGAGGVTAAGGGGGEGGDGGPPPQGRLRAGVLEGQHRGLLGEALEEEVERLDRQLAPLVLVELAEVATRESALLEPVFQCLGCERLGHGRQGRLQSLEHVVSEEAAEGVGVVVADRRPHHWSCGWRRGG